MKSAAQTEALWVLSEVVCAPNCCSLFLLLLLHWLKMASLKQQQSKKTSCVSLIDVLGSLRKHVNLLSCFVYNLPLKKMIHKCLSEKLEKGYVLYILLYQCRTSGTENRRIMNLRYLVERAKRQCKPEIS